VFSTVTSVRARAAGSVTGRPTPPAGAPPGAPVPTPRRPPEIATSRPGERPAPGAPWPDAPPGTSVDRALAAFGTAIVLSRVAAARAPAAAIGRLPLPPRTTQALLRAWEATARRGRVEASVAALRARQLADAVIPAVVRGVVSRLDVVGLVREFVDVNLIAGLLDVDAVVARVDLDTAVARVDLEKIIASLDLDAIVDRVDLDRVVGRLDLDAIVDRVDLDRVAARLDVDAVLERVDLIGLAEYVVNGVDLPAIIRTSTESVTSEMAQGVRVHTADADRAVERLVDRLLLRHQARRTAVVPQRSELDGGSAPDRRSDDDR